jgi:hypothetical protein
VNAGITEPFLFVLDHKTAKVCATRMLYSTVWAIFVICGRFLLYVGDFMAHMGDFCFLVGDFFPYGRFLFCVGKCGRYLVLSVLVDAVCVCVN